MKLTRSLLSSSGLVLLFAVLLGQFALFAHELEHAMEGESEQCMVCLLVDHQSALNGQAQEPVQLAQFSLVTASINSPVFSKTLLSYSSRAPPVT